MADSNDPLTPLLRLIANGQISPHTAARQLLQLPPAGTQRLQPPAEIQRPAATAQPTAAPRPPPHRPAIRGIAEPSPLALVAPQPYRHAPSGLTANRRSSSRRSSSRRPPSRRRLTSRQTLPLALAATALLGIVALLVFANSTASSPDANDAAPTAAVQSPRGVTQPPPLAVTSSAAIARRPAAAATAAPQPDPSPAPRPDPPLDPSPLATDSLPPLAADPLLTAAPTETGPTTSGLAETAFRQDSQPRPEPPLQTPTPSPSPTPPTNATPPTMAAASASDPAGAAIEPIRHHCTTATERLDWPLPTDDAADASPLALLWPPSVQLDTQWIQPLENASPRANAARRQQAILQWTLPSAPHPALRCQIDVRLTSRLQLRLHYTAQLTAEHRWQPFSTGELARSQNQLVQQMTQQSAVLSQWQQQYRLATNRQKAALRPQRDALEQSIEQLQATLLQLQQLAVLHATVQDQSPLSVQLTGDAVPSAH